MNLTSYLALIEPSLINLDQNKEPKALYEPIRYILALGGKRIRPAMCMMAAELVSNREQNALNQALAVEVFHNFSLMHDDIMDKAPLRRGKPTVHEKWNLATGILSGDVMLVRSFQILLEHTGKADYKTLFDVFSEVTVQICEGQQMDMDFEQRTDVTIAEYVQMITYKTAVLLGGSLKIGALVGGANPAQAQAFYDFGMNTGIAFQIKDDLLDAFGDPEKFGKTVGGDILADKKTYLWLLSAQHASTQDLETLLGAALIDNSKEKLAVVYDLYAKYDVAIKAQAAIEEYYQQSLKNLALLEQSGVDIQSLKQMADWLLMRDV